MTENKLEKIFAMQQELNAYVGNKHGIVPLATHMKDATMEERIEWLLKFNKALGKESNELDDCYVWKWWADDQGDFNWQNAKVEIVDILHFFVSMCLCVGITPQDLYDTYEKKWQINKQRQDQGYSVAGKTEDDNRNI